MPRRPFSSIFIRTARLADRPRAGQVASSGHSARHEYLEARRIEVDEKNARLAKAVRHLRSLLAVGLGRDTRDSIDGMFRGAGLADVPGGSMEPAPPDRQGFGPPPLGLVAGLSPGARRRHAEAVAAADLEFIAARAEWGRASARRREAIEKLRTEAQAHDRQIELFKAALAAGEPDAVKSYAQFVVANSPYPDIFHHEAKVETGPGSRELRVDLRAPATAEIIARTGRYEYRKADDEIVALPAPEADRSELYESVLAQLALRTLHEIFSSDVGRHIPALLINLHVVAIDPSTGKSRGSDVLSVRASRVDFEDLELAAVDPIACLERLVRLEAGGSGASAE